MKPDRRPSNDNQTSRGPFRRQRYIRHHARLRYEGAGVAAFANVSITEYRWRFEEKKSITNAGC